MTVIYKLIKDFKMNDTAVITEAMVDKELKEILACGFSLAEAVDAADADGVFNLMDIPLLIGPFTLLPNAIEGASKVKAIGKLSPAKLSELSAWAKNDLDLRHDATEERVEAVIDLILRVASVLAIFKK